MLQFNLTKNQKNQIMKKTTIFLSMFLLIFLSISTQAQFLDPNFGDNGIVELDASSDEKRIIDVAVQSDDKILVLSSEQFSGTYFLILTRLNPDGSVDLEPSFDVLDNAFFLNQHFTNGQIEILADGSIMIATNINEGNNNLHLSKFLADGTPDTSFGFNQRYTKTVNNFGNLTSSALLEDGIIYGIERGNDRIGVGKIKFDGDIDRDFGDNGFFIDQFFQQDIRQFNRTVNQLSVTENEEIILTGYDFRASLNIFSQTPKAFKLDTQGELINSFNGNPAFFNGFKDTKIDAAGNIFYLLADYSVIKVNADFTLDADFEANYKTPFFLGDNPAGSTNLKIENNGFITIYGIVFNQDLYSYQIAPNGTMNPNFGEDIQSVIQFDQYDAISNINTQVNGQSDGKTIFTFTASPGDTEFEQNELVLIRLQGEDPTSIEEKTFNLIDASNNTVITEIADGGVYTINSLKDDSLNIELDTKGDTTFNSYKVELRGPVQSFRVENKLPVAIFGDINGNYFGKSLIEGSYTLRVTPYTEVSAKGASGEPLVITFEIIDSAPRINEFVLIDTESGATIGNIEQNSSFSLDLSKEYNIIATASTGTSSAVLTVEGNNFNEPRVENQAPFTAFGDYQGVFKGGVFTPGVYSITVTPYAQAVANGVEGLTKTNTFTMVDSNENELLIIPNPVRDGEVRIEILKNASIAFKTYEIIDPMGRLIQSGSVDIAPTQEEFRIDVFNNNFDAGMYYLKIENKMYPFIK